MTLFDEIKSAGIPFASHESDLYIPITHQTRAIIERYQFKNNVSTFTNQVEGGQWYDVPFAYTPFWETKCWQPI